MISSLFCYRTDTGITSNGFGYCNNEVITIQGWFFLFVIFLLVCFFKKHTLVGSEALHNSLCLIYVQWKESQ